MTNEIPADELDELRVADEFRDGAVEGAEIAARVVVQRRAELDEAREALERAQEISAIMGRALDVADSKVKTLRRAFGVVLTADGYQRRAVPDLAGDLRDSLAEHKRGTTVADLVDIDPSDQGSV